MLGQIGHPHDILGLLQQSEEAQTSPPDRHSKNARFIATAASADLKRILHAELRPVNNGCTPLCGWESSSRPCYA